MAVVRVHPRGPERGHGERPRQRPGPAAGPLAKPATAAVGIFTFVTSWNNFLWPFIITSAGALQTVPVGLATVQTSYGSQYAQVMALSLLGALPLFVAFVLFQRQIVEGISSTGLKG